MKAALAYADALRIVGRQTEAVRIFKRAFESAANSTDESFVAIRIADRPISERFIAGGWLLDWNRQLQARRVDVRVGPPPEI
ncbi:MAG: hypothetical protein ABI885_07850 [Gammaproteobacteria bacterium]